MEFLFLKVTLKSSAVSFPSVSANGVVDSVVVSSMEDRSSIVAIVDSSTLIVENGVDESLRESSSLLDVVDSKVVGSAVVVAW